MLILTRHVGQTLIIDENIEVTVLSITKGQVKFGITAPREISVHREEVQKRIDAQKGEE